MKLRKLLLAFLAFSILLALPAYAHSGRTDGAGGHYDRFSGEYHYHHGYPAHQHPNGVCPYIDSVSRGVQTSSTYFDTFSFEIYSIPEFSLSSFPNFTPPHGITSHITDTASHDSTSETESTSNTAAGIIFTIIMIIGFVSLLFWLENKIKNRIEH